MADSLQLVIETLSAKENLKALLDSTEQLTKGLSALKTAIPSKFFKDIQQTSEGLDKFSTSLATVLTTASAINNIDTTKASTGFTQLATGVRSFTNEIAKIADSDKKVIRLFSGFKALDSLPNLANSMTSLNSVDFSKLSVGSTAMADFSKNMYRVAQSTNLANSAFAKFGGASVNLEKFTIIFDKLSAYQTANKARIDDTMKFTNALKGLASALTSINKVAASGSSFATLRLSLDLYIRAVEDAIRKHPDMVNKIIQLGNAIAAINPVVKEAANSVRKVDSAAKEAVPSLNLFSGGWTSILNAFIGGSIIYRTVTWIKQLVVEFANLEKAMYRINTIARLTPQGLRDAQAEVKGLSSQFGLSATEVSTALYEINSATITGADSLKVLKASAIQAVSGYTDIVGSATLISKVIKAYNKDASESAHITDVLFKTVERGINPMEELNKDFGRILAASNAAGISFETSAAAIATLTSRGLQTNLAVTALNAAIMKLSSGNKKLDEVFIRLGYSSSAAALRQKGLQFVMEELYKVTGGQMEQLKQLGFDYRDVRAATILTNEATTGFAENLRQIADPANTAGASLKALKETQKSLTQVFNEFKESTTNFGTSMLEWSGTTDVLKASLGVLTELLRAMNTEWVAITAGAVSIGILASSLAALGKVIITLATSGKVIAAIGLAGFGATAGIVALIAAITAATLAIALYKKKIGDAIAKDTVVKPAAVEALGSMNRNWLSQVKALDKLKKGTKEYNDQLAIVQSGARNMEIFAGENIYSGEALDSFKKGLQKTLAPRLIPKEDNAELEKVTKLREELAKLQRKEEAPTAGTFEQLNYLQNEHKLLEQKRRDYVNIRKGVGDLSRDSAWLQMTIDSTKAANSIDTLYAKLKKAAEASVAKSASAFETKGVTSIQKFRYSYEKLVKTFEENKGMFQQGNVASFLGAQAERAAKMTKEQQAQMLMFDISKIADPALRDKFIAIRDEIIKMGKEISFSGDSLLALNEQIKGLEYGRLTNLGKVKFLQNEINAKQKKYNELLAKGDAMSLGEAALLAGELGDLRGKMYDVTAKNPSYRKATMLEGVETGTRASIESITKAVASVYDKQIADNTKETSRYTKEQAAILKQLQKAGLKLVQ